MIALRLILGILEAGFFPGRSLLSRSLPLSLIHALKAACISFPLGIPDMICKNDTPSFTSSDAWPLHALVSWRMDLCKW